jgi:predicted  nucleic acid-binding Zn-ribbon protein
MSALAKNYDILSSETETLKDQNVHLKEENCKVSSNVQSLRESNLKLHAVMEEMLEKMTSKNSELQQFRDRLEAATHDLEQKEMESSVQIKQLKKLVDHLQQKQGKKSSTSDCSKNWSAAMPYEELQELLVKEQSRIKRLEEDVQRLRQEKVAATAGDSKKRSESKLPPLLVTTKTQHAIPHRFHKQTNMKSGLKCFVCQSGITLLTSSSACRFCGRVVHPACEASAPKDCGLPTDLAKVLGGGSSGSDISSGAGAVVEILHRGYLRVPSTHSGEWRTVAVHVSVDGKLVVEGGSVNESIELRPSRGSVHIQSCVSYSELLHTGAFDEAHVFKVVLVRVARVREVHYFCAKNMQASQHATWMQRFVCLREYETRC